MEAALKDGWFDVQSDDFELLTGRQPQSFRSFALERRSQLQELGSQFASPPVIILLKSITGSLSGAILILGVLAVALGAIVLITGIGTRSRRGAELASPASTANV